MRLYIFLNPMWFQAVLLSVAPTWCATKSTEKEAVKYRVNRPVLLLNQDKNTD